MQINKSDEKPLVGRRILLTRSEEQSAELAGLLEAQGASCLLAPCVELFPPDNWREVDRKIYTLARYIAKDIAPNGAPGASADSVPGDPVPSYDWLVFTSTNSVRFFCGRMSELGLDPVAVLAEVRLAAIGSATANRLADLGLDKLLIPDKYTAEGLLATLLATGVEGKRLLLPRALVARDILPRGLREAGARVDILPVYRNLAPPLSADVVKAIENKEIDLICFASSSAVTNFIAAWPEKEKARLLALLDSVLIACIGPISADTAKRAGIKVDVQPPRHTIQDLARAITKVLAR